MAVAVRALISIMMLAGFYVLAFVQLVLGLALAIWVASVTTGVIGAKIGAAVFLATVWAVGRGTWKALRADGAGPHGLPLDERDAPKLWEMVRELSDVVGTRMPDEIYLLPEVNAAVSERSRLMGLIPGRRYMYIGMPLLQRFTVAQLRSVLAHELGHYSGRHTRFAGISYRGRLALQRTISQISTVNIAGWVFRGYGRLFILVQNSVSRRQELEADLASVRVAGRAAAASALIQVEVLGTAFDDYMGRYVLPGIEAGYVPEDLFTGFAELLRVRAEEISALHATQRDDGGSSRWDTHPPTSTRLAAMMAVPESAADIDAGPARLLITDAAAAGRALQARLLPAAEFVALPWEEFLAATSGAGLQTNVNAILRAVSGAVNQPVPHAGAVLDLIEAGRIGEIAARILPDVPEPDGRKRFAEPLALLLSMAALRSGAARWQHSWIAPARLVGSDGAELDLTETAELATDPATLPEARQRLVNKGIDVKTAKHVQQVVNAIRAEVSGGITTMKVDGKRTDVLVLSNGLLLMPAMPRYKTGMARFRMNDWLAEGDARALAATPGSRFIPYEEIKTAMRTSGARFCWGVTLHNGVRMEIRTGWQSEAHGNSKELFTSAMRSATA